MKQGLKLASSSSFYLDLVDSSKIDQNNNQVYAKEVTKNN